MTSIANTPDIREAISAWAAEYAAAWTAADRAESGWTPPDFPQAAWPSWAVEASPDTEVLGGETAVAFYGKRHVCDEIEARAFWGVNVVVQARNGLLEGPKRVGEFFGFDRGEVGFTTTAVNDECTDPRAIYASGRVLMDVALEIAEIEAAGS